MVIIFPASFSGVFLSLRSRFKAKNTSGNTAEHSYNSNIISLYIYAKAVLGCLWISMKYSNAPANRSASCSIAVADEVDSIIPT